MNAGSVRGFGRSVDSLAVTVREVLEKDEPSKAKCVYVCVCGNQPRHATRRTSTHASTGKASKRSTKILDIHVYYRGAGTGAVI